MSSFTSSEDGFTVLEVIVAFVIAALVLTALYHATSEAYRSFATSRLREETLAFARSELEAIGVDGRLRSGTHNGSLQNGVTWRLEVVPLALREPLEVNGTRAYRVVLEAVGRDGRTVVRLETIKLGWEDQ